MLLEGGIEKNYTQNWDKNGNIYYTDENGRVVDFKVNPFVKFANKVKAGASNFGDWINESNPNSEAYKQKVGLVAGLATAPFGIGELATAGVTRALAPYVGRKIAQNMATGLGSGVVGGGVGGVLEAGLNNENILAGGLKGSILGGLSGLLGGYGLGKVAQKLNTQTAWHGSPYKFDKFSNEAIGTGEGAQAHGYGHYAALNKDVAKRYKDVLGEKPHLYEEYKSLKEHINLLTELDKKKPLNETLKQALNNSKNKLYYIENNFSPDDYLPQGNLYKLSIPKDDVMLREDLLLSEQPNILNKLNLKNIDNVEQEMANILEYIKNNKNVLPIEDLNNLRKQYADLSYKKMLNNPNSTGKKFYDALSDSLGSDEFAAKFLQDKGIKGISYNGGIDGEARVIFNPDDIDIIPYYDNPTSFKEKFINLLSR